LKYILHYENAKLAVVEIKKIYKVKLQLSTSKAQPLFTIQPELDPTASSSSPPSISPLHSPIVPAQVSHSAFHRGEET
jgi:hypothetical protein